MLREVHTLEEIMARHIVAINKLYYFSATNRKTGEKKHFLLTNKHRAEKLRIDIKWLREKPAKRQKPEDAPIMYDVPLELAVLTVDDIGKMMDKKAVVDAYSSLGR
jgi:hypothetical protein